MTDLTPADRKLAALDIELAKRLGEEPDPRMVAIANGELPGETPNGERNGTSSE